MARSLYGFCLHGAMRVLLLATLLLSACGQVGPLVLPDKNKPAEKAQPAPAPPGAPEDVERQKKQTVPPSQNPQSP